MLAPAPMLGLEMMFQAGVATQVGVAVEVGVFVPVGVRVLVVVLVRVPFEVPIDPPQIARLAYLQTQGRDAFGEHTLPMAKMLMRQGAGRLIRHAD